METIKISVEVSVNLSENTQNFIKSLFASVPTPAPASKPQTAAPAQTKPAATPAPGASAAQTATSASKGIEGVRKVLAQTATSASKGIEDVRKLLAQKVNEHRDAIKQKLNELGAPSVTKLDPTKYDEMYNFLNSL